MSNPKKKCCAALFCLLLCVNYAAAAPLNDECVNASVVAKDITYYGSSTGATGSSVSGCGGADINDVWHKFTPSSSGLYTVSLCGSSFDTTLSVYDGCGGAELACSDDYCGTESELSSDLIGGQTYYIRVAGFDIFEEGAYELLVTGSSAGGSHDECADAIAVTRDVTYYGSNVGATGSQESSCVWNDTNDVWHSFTPSSSGLHTVSLCGSSYDTSLSIYSGCGGSELACNDDSCGLQSEVSDSLIGGQTYYIRVAGYGGESGSYELLVSAEVCDPPTQAASPMPANNDTDSAVDTILSWDGSVPMFPDVGSSPTQKIIYGNDDRLDEYEVSNSSHLTAGDSTVAILPPSYVTYNGNGTVTLYDETFAEYYLSNVGVPLCSDEPYLDQPTPAFCSGFLVAPDIVATAGHCATGSTDCSNSVFVFGFVMDNATTARITIDESQVYYCSEIIQRKLDGSSDWALVRLDRAVPDHIPLNVDRSGVSSGDNLLVIGHPVGLPRKYAGGATVRDNSPAAYFQANVDTYGGNSGSAVFNASSMDVAGILVRGNPDFVADGSCHRSNVCPDSGGCSGNWEDVTRSTEFANVIPSWDVYLQEAGGSESLVCSDTVAQWCDPGPLQCGTTYNWRVVAKNRCGQESGSQWSFATEPSGDLDSDCSVDGGDFADFGKEWLETTCSSVNQWCNGADMNQDNSVDIVDLQEFALYWMDSAP